ncbi:unnamed protein product [Trifolium pratense]|nr:unnamed protein product [Trifolium pratense]
MPQVFLQFKYSRFFFSLSKKSLHHHLATPPLRYADKCIGSIKGWLIMSDNSERVFVKCFFWNPVTNVRIMIPSKLPLPPTCEYFPVRGDREKPQLKKMVASSKPNCNGSSDCHLVGLFDDFCHIAIYKLFEKSWTIVVSDKDSGFRDVEIIGTKLYVAVSDSSSSSILVYCLKDSINGPPKAKVLAEFPIISILKWQRSNGVFCYLAKDEALRELYFIYMFCNVVTTPENRHINANGFRFFTDYAQPLQVNNFEMFKLDTNKDPIGWQNVELEDRVAFVSNLSSIVMSRDELNFNKDLIRGNIIYFAFHHGCAANPWASLQLGMFCLTDSSIKYFPVKKLKHDDIPRPYPVWFVPSLL